MTEKLVIGKTVKIPCMRPGLCRYDQENETILLSAETLAEMSKTSHGIPVIIDHQDVDSGNVEQVTVGRVADMHLEDDGVWWAHFVVDTQDAVDRLQNGWGVSTGYGVLGKGPGGTLNNVPYDAEVTEAKYLHLAIVQRPRYEMAKGPVFYNSLQQGGEVATIVDKGNPQKNSGGSRMSFKLWRTKREEVKCNEAEDMMVEVDGKSKSLNDLLNEMHGMEMKRQADEDKSKLMNGDDEVEYKGEKIKVNELVKRYQELKGVGCEKPAENSEQPKEEQPLQNADEAKVEPKENAEEPKEEKENAEEKETPAEEKKEEKQNSMPVESTEHFQTLENAHDQGNMPTDPIGEFQTLKQRVDAGRAAYGSVK